jgi:hypothetical protein
MPRDRRAPALNADVGADLDHHLVGLQARLVRWRDDDDAAVDAGWQELMPADTVIAI